MRRNIRLFLKIVVGMILLFEGIELVVVCIKTVIFEDFDPRIGVETFTYMIGIALCLWVIRWVMKPEYNSEYINRHHNWEDMFLRCDDCDAQYTEGDNECPNCGVDV